MGTVDGVVGRTVDGVVGLIGYRAHLVKGRRRCRARLVKGRRRPDMLAVGRGGVRLLIQCGALTSDHVR